MPRIHLSCESQSIGKLSEKAKSVVFAFSSNRLGSRKPRREAPAVFREFEGDTVVRRHIDILSARQRLLRFLRPFRGTHTMQWRKFTLFPKGKALPNRGALRKIAISLARINI